MFPHRDGEIKLNVDWLFHLPAPIRRTLYFGLQRAIGSQVGNAYQRFLTWARFSPEQVDHQAESHLARLLQHASVTCEFYKALHIPRKASAKEWLRSFPILTRSDVRAKFASLVTDGLRDEIPNTLAKSKKRYDWVIVKTGGTTGLPTTVLHDAALRDSGRASRLFSQKLCGFPLGTRYFKLWGSEQDLLQQKENLDRRILRNLLGEVPLNSFRASRSDMQKHVQTIRSHPGIQHMMAYIDSAAALGSFASEEKIKLPLKSVMGCAGNVTLQSRNQIRQAFNCSVFDKYGSRECNDIACECHLHQGLHIYSPAVFVEIVDDFGQPIEAGKSGRILVTMLNNYSFPMIRYEIGDVGVQAKGQPCPCGLPFPKLAEIQGRLDDMLYTAEGTVLTSVFVRHMIGVALNNQMISEWQLEQISPKEIVFRYVPTKKNELRNTLDSIQNAFHRALGPEMVVVFAEVPEIPPSATGKHRWIINRCKIQEPNSSRT